MTYFAILPMYDWPETQIESDALWARVRTQLVAQGIDSSIKLVRRNADLSPVPGGIYDDGGRMIAPDPATLDPDEFDLHVAWRHPGLIFGQTCWGPMEQGLAHHVRLVGQPDYSEFEGGQGIFYRSAILMREGERASVPVGEGATLPLMLLRGARLAFNGSDSMSGIIGLERDLKVVDENLDIFSRRTETGSHQASIRAVAEGQADICTIDCRTLDLARRFEPALRALTIVGWTARRKGLPYIAAQRAPAYKLNRELALEL